MFKEVNHARTEAILNYIRILPESEQEYIASSLPVSKSKKKLSAREKKKIQELKGIAEGLKEIKEAKRGDKQLMDLEDALNEL